MNGKIILLLFLISVCSVYAVQLIEPVAVEIKGGETINVGTIGPGQTISIDIARRVYVGGKFGTGGDYDLALATNLPSGWKSTESKLYDNPLQVTITAAKDAAEGKYSATVKVLDEDNKEMLGNISFTVNVNIIHDVMDLQVNPVNIETGAGQPAKFQITITNKGSASDVFELRSENVKRWIFKKYIYVAGMSSKTIPYEIAANEEETFNPKIIVESTSSSIISEEKVVTLKVSSNVLNDYEATNHGTLIFPVIEGPIYAIMGLLSNLW